MLSDFSTRADDGEGMGNVDTGTASGRSAGHNRLLSWLTIFSCDGGIP